MNALQRLQRDFQRYVYQRDGRMTAQVVGTERIGAQARLEIYADAYRLRLLDVLADDLPGLKALAGEEKFEHLGRAYIESHPSPYFNVRWYGDALADFLHSAHPWAEEPALAEMAALEWAMTRVFDAPDEPVAAVNAVAAIPPTAWPTMVPVPLNATQQLSLHWNVAAIRKAVDQKTDPPAPQQLNPAQEWLVWRKDLTVYYRPLEPDEAWAFQAIAGGANFADICAGLCEWTDETHVAARAAAILRRWVEDGLICEIK